MVNVPKISALCVVAAGGLAWVVMIISAGSVMNREVEGFVLLSVRISGKVLK